MRTESNSQTGILMITPYAHPDCTISHYSMNLISAIKDRFSDSFNMRVGAIEQESTERNFPSEVRYVFNSQQKSEYKRLAAKINADETINAVFVQHDFHLFGGDFGSYLLILMRALKKPVFVCFHSVFISPEAKRTRIVKRIAKRAEMIFCLTEFAFDQLSSRYSIPERKLKYIPSGTYTLKNKNKIDLKHKYGFEGRTVISTHGLICQNKNLEKALESISLVTDEYPDVMYLIIGKSHPESNEKENEDYRDKLMNHVLKLGLQKNVFFINKHLELPELLELLQMTDVYFYTSSGKSHSVSGTLINAVNGACPIVAASTAFSTSLVTEEMGKLISIEDTQAVSKALLQILNDEDLSSNMRKNVLQRSKENEWCNSALKHCSFFNSRLSTERLSYNLPDVSLKQLIHLTHNFGVVQSVRMDQAIYSSGYSLKHNAIALVTVCMNYEVGRDARSLILIEKYLRFIGTCQREDGTFAFQLDEVGNEYQNTDDHSLEESIGRVIWALGSVVANHKILPKVLVTRAELYMSFAIPTLAKLSCMRAKAYCIKGLYLFNSKYQNRQIKELIVSLGTSLVEEYGITKDGDWRWFDRTFSKSDCILPESLLYVYLTSSRGIFKLVAQATFDFLLSQHSMKELIEVIPWDHKKENTSIHDIHPSEVASLIQTTQVFFEIFKEKRYQENMEIAFSWFLGNNHLHQMIYDPFTGGCHDSLGRSKINLNQGAESTVSYLMARLCLEKSRRHLPTVQEKSNYKPQYAQYAYQPIMTIHL